VGSVRVVVVGAGAAGLFAALLLARDGHEVVVLDRDRLDLAADVESASAAAFRGTAPQLVQPHIVLALCRELLLQRLPDVHAGLLAAGVAEAALATQQPPTLTDRAERPGDERLTVLMTRRSTFDWVLRRAAEDQPGVSVEGGVRVTGLLAGPGDPPRVVGVRTDDGDVPADLVVGAARRRSPVDEWLTAIGAAPSAVTAAECGVAYFSRHYRLRPGADLPGLPTTRVVVGLDEFTAGIWGGDNGTMVTAVAPLVEDHRFRGVRDPEVFTAVLRSVPYYAGWLEVMDPITPVFPMGGLHNTLRRCVLGGRPPVAGLLAVGDSVCTTNPTLGRGLSLALRGAVGLADAVRTAPGDPRAQALAMDALLTEHIAPFYADQARIDATRLAVLRHRIHGAPAPPPPPATGPVAYAELRAAAAFDPVAFRAFWTVMGMLRRPDEVYRDPEVVARTRAAIRVHGTAPPLAQPTREQLLAALRLPAAV
jgi:2-polyprenyl-6-methoxyphenol hydroxylase-like FAD-dependent oxidoreductase